MGTMGSHDVAGSCMRGPFLTKKPSEKMGRKWLKSRKFKLKPQKNPKMAYINIR